MAPKAVRRAKAAAKPTGMAMKRASTAGGAPAMKSAKAAAKSNADGPSEVTSESVKDQKADGLSVAVPKAIQEFLAGASLQEGHGGETQPWSHKHQNAYNAWARSLRSRGFTQLADSMALAKKPQDRIAITNKLYMAKDDASLEVTEREFHETFDEQKVEWGEMIAYEIWQGKCIPPAGEKSKSRQNRCFGKA